MLLDPNNPIARLTEEDPRYKPEAYIFVFESLRYAQVKLGLGEELPPEDEESESSLWSESEEEDYSEEEADFDAEMEALEDGGEEETSSPARNAPKHLTGQELCEAIRLFAQEQFGLMAKCVLNSWGVHSTSDFGEIVYNLIKAGEMRKTPNDEREDFDDVYDFEEGLVKSFKITAPRKP